LSFDPVMAEYDAGDVDDSTVDVPAKVDDADDADDGGSDALRGFRRNLAEIEQRIASMSLVDDGPAPVPADDTSPAGVDDTPQGGEDSPQPADQAGAVAVFAGIGGPDAVRQFLGGLPPGFPRPVLIHQQLDGGHHDRLVQQMARATQL